VILLHLVPGFDDEGLEGVNTAVGGSVYFPLHDAPNKKVQGVEVGGVWGPEILATELGHVLLAELLALDGVVAGGACLAATHSLPLDS
jgi:hypothetical protein